MEKLLEKNWEEEYQKHIKSLEFSDENLKTDFLKLLSVRNPKSRESKWSDLVVKNAHSGEGWKLSNPFYIGFGNPNSNILFLGKEKGFDIDKRPDLFVKESINNVLQWELINEMNAPLNHKEVQDTLGFNPFFPRLYHKQKIGKAHTWGFYSKIVAGLENLNQDEIFYETDTYENSFFNSCFMSEINHIPSKYSQGNKLNNKRKEFLSQQFYRRFPIIIIGAKGYLDPNDIVDIFSIGNSGKEILLGANRQREFWITKFTNSNQKIIYCNQLSQAAGWPKGAIDKLINELI